MNTSKRTNRIRLCGWLTAAVVFVILPHLVGGYGRFLSTEILIWTTLAISVNIVFGYTGLLSFAQALFFGVAGYAFALLMFHTEMGILTAMMLSVLAGGLVSAVIAIYALRVTGHYFVIVTIIFSLVLYFVFLNASDITGGDAGLPFEIPPLNLLGYELDLYDSLTNYYFVLVATATAFVIYRQLVGSSLGLVFKAVRENEDRARFLGYSVASHRALSFIIGGLFAALAGVLYSLLNRYANAMLMHWTVSGEGVVWTILGGRGTVLGPLVGTSVLLVFKDWVSSWNQHIYPIIVGCVLVATVILTPQGIVGTVSQKLWPWLVRQLGIGAWFGSPPERPLPEALPALEPEIALAEYFDTMPDFELEGCPVMQVENLGKQFSELKVLDGVSFSLPRSDLDDKLRTNVVAMIGPNGCGKTTLFNVVTGLFANHTGRVKISGRDVSNWPAHRIARMGMIRTFQTTSLFWELTLEENIALGVMRNSWFLNPLFSWRRSPNVMREIDSILQVTGLKEHRNKRASELSHGMQRLLEIGVALAARPMFLLMDEPTSGLSAEATQSFVRVIRAIAKHIPVLMIEHDLEVVHDLAEHVLVLADGKLIAQGLPQDVEKMDAVRNAFWKGELQEGESHVHSDN